MSCHLLLLSLASRRSDARCPVLKLRPVSNPRSSHDTHSRSSTPLSPLILQPLSPMNNQNFNTAQPRRHSIFSPRIINSPLPNPSYHSPIQSYHSPHIPAPHIAPQPFLPYNYNFASATNSASLPNTPGSLRSHHSSPSSTPLKISLPSTKDIPLLTGKHDWGPWHSAVSSLILCSNLSSHIAEALLPGAAYDPDLWPTYPPVLQPDSSPDERIEFSNWWARDGVVTHILTSRLSPTALSSLPIANLRLAQRRSARDVYQTLRNNYGAGDYSAVMVIEARLRQLRCLPMRGGVRVPDYVSTWRTGYNQMEAAGHLPSERQLLAMFVDGLPTNAVPYVTLYDNVLNSLNDANGLPNLIHLFDHVIRIENNLLRTRLLNPNHRSLPIASSTSSPLTPNKTAAPASTPSATATVICGNCGRPHATDKCFQPGGAMEGKRAEVLSSRPLRPQAHLAGIDEEMEPEEENKTDDLNVLTNEFVAMSVSQNNKIPFSSYALSSVATTSKDIPMALATISRSFNSALDSACTNHIIRDRNLFHRYDPDGGVPVKTANCGFLKTLAVGDVKFNMTLSNGRTIIWTLKNCLHAPMVPINLISVGALQEHRLSVTFSYQKTTVSFPSDHPDLSGLSFEATVHRRLSLLDLDFIIAPSVDPIPIPEVIPIACPVFPVPPITVDLWHRRLGHLGQDATRDMLSQDFATGITVPTSSLNVPTKCIPCLIGKSAQAPYQHNGNRASQICELIHINTCSPFPTLTPRKEQYFTIFLDDAANFGHTELLVAKSDSFVAYKKVKASWELKSGNQVKNVRFDGAKEFTQGPFARHLATHGIAVQVTAPYAHSQAGKAERYIQTIEDGIQTLLADAKLPPSFWGDAALTYQYIRNRVPTSTLPGYGTTPHEVMNGAKPDLSHLRVWGCQCFPAIPPELRTKGGPRRYEAIFVGYEENRVGWRVRDLKGKYHFSRDVVFNESVPGHLSPRRGGLLDFDSLPEASIIPTAHLPSDPILPSTSPPHSIPNPLPTPTLVDTIFDRDTVLAGRHQRTTRSSTNSLPPMKPHYNDIDVVNMFISHNDLTTFLSTSSLSPTTHDSYLDNLDLLFDQCFLTAPPSFIRNRPFDLSKPPNSYHEATHRPDKSVWLAAMQREYDSLEERKAFERTPLPTGRKAIGVRWTYDYKYEPDGSIIRGKEKARLVAQGFSQRSEDFDETYAPVVKLVSVRILLAFANHHDYEIMNFDVKTAFLHARLPYSIYVKQIPGYPEDDPTTVLCQLVALYGLKQSAFEWYTLLTNLFSDLGLFRCEADYAVFIGRWSTPPDPTIDRGTTRPYCSHTCG